MTIFTHITIFFRIVEEDEPMHDDFHKPQAFFDQVHDGIVLPLEICDHLLQTMVAEGLDIDDRVAKAFRYRKKIFFLVRGKYFYQNLKLFPQGEKTLPKTARIKSQIFHLNFNYSTFSLILIAKFVPHFHNFYFEFG